MAVRHAERPRAALIHALAQSIEPINAELARAWPECVRMNLLDDSLSADLARAGGLDAGMTERFLRLGEYAVATGADAILFSCSAFGPCIEAVARRFPGIPVLKPNEAMIAEAARLDGAIGLVATFGPTIDSMRPEFPAGSVVHARVVAEALDALQSGDPARHDALVVAAAAGLVREGPCAAVALAQFSMARARDAVARAVGVPVLTTVGSAVRELRRRMTSGDGRPGR